MILEYQGKDWQFDRDAITIDEWRQLKKVYKLTPKGFQDGIGEADPDASTFLYWVMLRQNGDQQATLGDHLRPDIIALNEAIAKAEPGEEPAGEAEADPTKTGASPAASTPASASPPAAPSPPSAAEGGVTAPTGS